MLILAINTASSHTGIALLETPDIILGEKSWKSNNDEAEKLMPAINKLLKESGKNFKDIEKIIVVKGPGSFTGLRVGVTVANTIAYLNKCELFEINTFEYWWAASHLNAESHPSDSGTALLIYAGSRGVYVSLDPSDAGELVNLDQLNQYLKDKKVEKVFGDITEDQKRVLENTKFTEIKETFGKIIEKISQARTTKSVKIVEPHYIKPPSITKSKKPFV